MKLLTVHDLAELGCGCMRQVQVASGERRVEVEVEGAPVSSLPLQTSIIRSECTHSTV